LPHPSGTLAPVDPQNLIAQPEYARTLRPLLPDEAFTPDRATPIVLGLNGAILLLGWAMARQLDASHWQGLLIFLPFALVMGNAVVVLLFATHDVMHRKAIRQPQLRQAVQLLGLALLWMPPTLWKAVHNREHHGKTNSEQDPDRNYTLEQPPSWGKVDPEPLRPLAGSSPLLAVGGNDVGLGCACLPQPDLGAAVQRRIHPLPRGLLPGEQPRAAPDRA